MTISVGTPSTDQDNGVSSVTFSHTVTAGKGSQLIVGVSFNNDNFETITGITYDGNALSLVIAHDRDDDSRAEMWRLQDPPVGTANVVITLDGTLTTEAGIISGAFQLDEVDSVTPVGATASDDGDSATNSITVGSNAGELAFEVSAMEQGSFDTPGAGQTVLWNLQAGSAAKIEDGCCSYKDGASPNVTLEWANDDDKWVMLGVSFRPSVAPSVDAGGPYSGTVSTPIALNATVTPGTDVSPALTWTIDAGPGGGTFLPSANVEDPTFTPDTVGAYTLRLTAVTVDAPDVFDTASLDSMGAFVAPTVDAGGPYSGDYIALTPLDATVVAGSDPTPVLLWTIESDPPFPGTGNFSNDAIEDPTFQPFNVGDYILRLTVTPSDGPAVFDDADFESLAVPPTVDAGGPYTGDPGVPTQLDGTVTVGSSGDITYKWTIDSGGLGSFSSDTILDPLFTPDDVGPYVLRLTATALDGPVVFDTATFSATAIADAQILNGRLIRGGTQELVLSQLALGADPPAGFVYVEGTAQAGSGEMYVAIDDGVVPRVFIAGIAHQHNGVRLVTLNAPEFFVSGWGIDGNGAQCVGGTGTGHANEGIKVTNDGYTVVDGVTPGPGPTPTPFPQPAAVIHDFDFGDQSQMFAGPAFNFPIADNGGITRVLNKGSDGTPLEYSGVGSEAPLWIQNPTGPAGITGAARFTREENSELLANIVANHGNDLTVAMIFKGMEDPSPGMRQMYWGSPGQNALGVAYRAPANDTGSTLLFGQIASGDAAFGTINPFSWYMIVGSVDAVANFVSQRTGATAFTGVLGAGSGPGPNKTFRLGDRSDGLRQYGGDIARTWVWGADLSAAEVQQMLDWGDENYGPFSYNGVPTLPPIQNDLLDTISVPFNQLDTISGISPDILKVTTSFDTESLFPGDTIEQNAVLSPNVDLTGKYLIERIYSDAQFHDTAILDRNIPAPFGPYAGISFDPPPYNFVLDLLYDSTADEGLLAVGLTLNWFSTLIQLPTDGVSNWESYGVVPGDILRFENSVNHPPVDIRCRGFQVVQGGGGRDIQTPTGSVLGLPYIGADVADVRLIKRATK